MPARACAWSCCSSWPPLSPERGPLLDVGTGSGVLAIAAARLGFAPVLGLDHERESVEAARANAVVNGVEIEVRRFDLRTQPLPWLNAGRRSGAPIVVVANLLRPLLLELAGRCLALRHICWPRGC